MRCPKSILDLDGGLTPGKLKVIPFGSVGREISGLSSGMEYGYDRGFAGWCYCSSSFSSESENGLNGKRREYGVIKGRDWDGVAGDLHVT